MISYNTASRALCLKIKEHLESHGYRVWIDISDIHGSSLDSMAKAVENSVCILMCVTEKYRQSVNCQAEAQYAFKLNKKIIPLIMQSGYESIQGWMGIIMGDKIFVNFTKYEFGECLRRLKNELDTHCIHALKEKIDRNACSAIYQACSTNAKKKFSLTNESSEKEVQDWFSDQNLNMAIFEYLKPCDGEILKQMHDMKCKAPEFYYRSLEKILKDDLRSIALFTSRLNNLYS